MADERDPTPDPELSKGYDLIDWAKRYMIDTRPNLAEQPSTGD